MGILSLFRKRSTASIYDRIGGREALEVVVEDFYCRVIDDDQWLFTMNLGMGRLGRHAMALK
jgi:truncated hemoglobin YjbI